MRVGITGQIGFVGTHLYHHLGLFPDEFERVSFDDGFFCDADALRRFVCSCDAVVHLAAVNRCANPGELYETNVGLVRKLIAAMEAEGVRPHVLFSSSIQEDIDNPYGRSKAEGRRLLAEWASKVGADFSGLIIPNVFGPFGRPFYNSFVATFAHQLNAGERPSVHVDAAVKLIDVGSLCRQILGRIRAPGGVASLPVPCDCEKRVTEVLALFERFHELYATNGVIPEFRDRNELNLFNAFRSYIDPARHFPVKLAQHVDERGCFVETIRHGCGGQSAFSTTAPGVTRGNHFHTRKVERFTVIKGKARIQLRRIGTADVLNFDLDGAEPAYVDMPVWYTHNITNVGSDPLYTQFWINEWFDPKDGDTYYEKV